MSEGYIIFPEAEAHGIDEDDMLHAINHAIRIYVQDDAMTMYIGPDQSGQLFEIGTIELRGGQTAIAQAMPARRKYTDRLRKRP